MDSRDSASSAFGLEEPVIHEYTMSREFSCTHLRIDMEGNIWINGPSSSGTHLSFVRISGHKVVGFSREDPNWYGFVYCCRKPVVYFADLGHDG